MSVDYRLAPEHPHPAAVEDAVAAYAGLLDGEAAPSAIAAVLMSPWVDLTLSGASMSEKAALDPALTPAGLQRRAADYAGGKRPGHGADQPDLRRPDRMPPLLIQAGSHEILLDDAIRLAARAAAADVAVTLEITPDVPHVLQGFAAMLDEDDAALTRAGAFLREHLGG